MAAPKALEDLIPSRRSQQRRPEHRLVQVSARVPQEVRDGAHVAASALGISMTELVERALRAEIARATDPAAQFAADVCRSIQQRLSAALRDGTWDEAVASYSAGDADLAP